MRKKQHNTKTKKKQVDDTEADKETNKLNTTKENRQFRYKQNVNDIISERFNDKNAFKLNGEFMIESTQNTFKTNRFFKDGEELGFFIDAVLDKKDNNPNVFFAGDVFDYHRNFKQVKRADYGKGANDFYDIVEYKTSNAFFSATRVF